MKRALMVFSLLAALSAPAWADCENDCNGPFQTCLNLCRQTQKPDSKGGSDCVNRCTHGLSGCQKRCQAASKKK